MWDKLRVKRTERELGSARLVLGAALGGSVRVFSMTTVSDRFERRTVRRLSTWTRVYLRDAAIVDFGCAVVGVFMAAQIRFGNEVTHGLSGPEPGVAGPLDRGSAARRSV